MKMPEGKVNFFNGKNKFGFITENGSRKEYYTYSKYLVHPVKKGDLDTFEFAESARDPVTVMFIQCLQSNNLPINFDR